jgi:fatty-acid peroxygenase
VNHRCPGEPVTVALIEQSIDFLTRRLTYDVPRQDVEIDFGRQPALRRDRFVIANVRVVVRD